MGWIIPMLAKHFRFPVAIWAAIAICLLLWPPQLPPGEVGWIFPILVDLVCLSPNGTREPEVFTNLGSFSCQTLQVSSGNLSCHWNLLASVAFPAPPGWRGWDFPIPVDFTGWFTPKWRRRTWSVCQLGLGCLPNTSGFRWPFELSLEFACVSGHSSPH